MEFSSQLKIAREKLQISQESLARELDVSFATINRLEQGKSYPSYLTSKKFEEFCKSKNIILEEK